jgi:hypothetical protein
MNLIIKVGVVLGLLVSLWTFTMGFTGWYKNPRLESLFYVVILIQIGVLVWGLKKAAKGARTYLGIVAGGTLMSLIGGVIIFFGSLLFTLVVFPNYFDEIRTVGIEIMRATGLPETEIATRVQSEAWFQTSFMQAFLGFVFTVVTGLLASLVIAAFVRKK